MAFEDEFFPWTNRFCLPLFINDACEFELVYVLYKGTD